MAPCVNRRARYGIVALILVTVGFAALGQGFGTPSGFGPPAAAVGGDAQERTVGGRDGFFVHDQLAKLVVLLGLSGAAIAVLLTHAFRWRRLLLAVSVIVLGFVLGGVLCPMAAVQNVILKAGTGYLLLFLVPVVLAVLFGRVFCGSVCPFGALQELVHVRRWALRIPPRIGRVLSVVRSLFLVALVARVAATGTSVLDGATPFKAFFEFGGTPVTVAVSALVLVLSIFTFRPFCRVACPLGAFLALVSRLRIFGVRGGAKCVSCKQCDRACAADAMCGGKSRPEECLLCGDCFAACPVAAISIVPPRR